MNNIKINSAVDPSYTFEQLRIGDIAFIEGHPHPGMKVQYGSSKFQFIILRTGNWYDYEDRLSSFKFYKVTDSLSVVPQ